MGQGLVFDVVQELFFNEELVDHVKLVRILLCRMVATRVDRTDAESCVECIPSVSFLLACAIL